MYTKAVAPWRMRRSSVQANGRWVSCSASRTDVGGDPKDIEIAMYHLIGTIVLTDVEQMA